MNHLAPMGRPAHNLIYAGIGSRETPQEMLQAMTNIARQLSPTGWLLRSGHARGADLAFERGAKHREIHLPWSGYNNQIADGMDYIEITPTPEIVDVAARHHPAWEKLSETVKMFMIRNATIILGQDLQTHAKMVVCWTPNAKLVGGTSHGIRIAQAFDIPVFNLADIEQQNRFTKFVLEL